MCEKCWIREVNVFLSGEDWREFSRMLATKLEAGELQYNSVNNEQSIYYCTSCNEQWKLKTPEEFPGGHLLQLKTEDGRKAIPSTIAIIVVIGVLALLFAKLFQYIFGS